MSRTMTSERFAHVVASILNGDQSNGYNADARLMLAELDAERAAHNETKAERDHYRNAARSAERSLVNGCHADARATLHAAFKRNSEREV